MSQLCQHIEQFEALNAAMLIVTFQGDSLAKEYLETHDLPCPIVIDEKLSLYHAYGMERGNWWDVWGPGSIWLYAKLMLAGRRVQPKQGDPRQLGGDVLIDPDGIVRIHHVGKGPADRPAIESILRRIRET